MTTHLKGSMSEQHQHSQENPSRPGTPGIIYFKPWKQIAANQDCLSPKVPFKISRNKDILRKAQRRNSWPPTRYGRILKESTQRRKEGRKTIDAKNTGKSNIMRRPGRQRRAKKDTPQKTHKPANTNRGKMKNNNSINQKNSKITEVNKCLSIIILKAIHLNVPIKKT